MKKRFVSLLLLSSCFIAHSTNAISGSRKIIFQKRFASGKGTVGSAYGTWGRYAPLRVTEGDSYLPGFDNDCDKLYGQLNGTSGYFTYNIDDCSGFMTGIVQFLGRTIPFSGGGWATEKLPPILLTNVLTIGTTSSTYSLAELSRNPLDLSRG